MLWAFGTLGTLLFTKIDIETRRKESKWAKIDSGNDEKKEEVGAKVNGGYDAESDTKSDKSSN